jgi:hypothetical protein
MPQNLAKRVTFLASDWIQVFPEDGPDTYRDVYINNQSGTVIRFRFSDETANTSLHFEISSTGSFALPQCDTGRLEGKVVSTHTQGAVTFLTSPRMYPK